MNQYLSFILIFNKMISGKILYEEKSMFTINVRWKFVKINEWYVTNVLKVYININKKYIK